MPGNHYVKGYRKPEPKVCECRWWDVPSPWHCGCLRWKRAEDPVCETCAQEQAA